MKESRSGAFGVDQEKSTARTEAPASNQIALRSELLTPEEAQMLLDDFFRQAIVSDDDKKWQRLIAKLRRIAGTETAR